MTRISVSSFQELQQQLSQHPELLGETALIVCLAGHMYKVDVPAVEVVPATSAQIHAQELREGLRHTDWKPGNPLGAALIKRTLLCVAMGEALPPGMPSAVCEPAASILGMRRAASAPLLAPPSLPPRPKGGLPPRRRVESHSELPSSAMIPAQPCPTHQHPTTGHHHRAQKGSHHGGKHHHHHHHPRHRHRSDSSSATAQPAEQHLGNRHFRSENDLREVQPPQPFSTSRRTQGKVTGVLRMFRRMVSGEAGKAPQGIQPIVITGPVAPAAPPALPMTPAQPMPLPLTPAPAPMTPAFPLPRPAGAPKPPPQSAKPSAAAIKSALAAAAAEAAQSPTTPSPTKRVSVSSLFRGRGSLGQPHTHSKGEDSPPPLPPKVGQSAAAPKAPKVGHPHFPSPKVGHPYFPPSPAGLTAPPLPPKGGEGADDPTPPKPPKSGHPYFPPKLGHPHFPSAPAGLAAPPLPPKGGQGADDPAPPKPPKLGHPHFPPKVGHPYFLPSPAGLAAPPLPPKGDQGADDPTPPKPPKLGHPHLPPKVAKVGHPYFPPAPAGLTAPPLPPKGDQGADDSAPPKPPKPGKPLLPARRGGVRLPGKSGQPSASGLGAAVPPPPPPEGGESPYVDWTPVPQPQQPPSPAERLYPIFAELAEETRPVLFIPTPDARFANIRSPEATNVPLLVHGVQQKGVIHANRITHPSHHCRPIATQYPAAGSSLLPITEARIHFWRMLIEQRGDLILDLTKPEEQRKLGPVYYPEFPGTSLRYGHITITRIDDGSSTLCRYKVEDAHTGESRELSRYQFCEWPDHGEVTPSVLHRLAGMINHHQHPVVHCRAGVGRTGTATAAAIMRHHHEHGRLTQENAVDLLTQTVLQLREQRGPVTVQTPGQWELLTRYTEWLLQRHKPS